MRQQTIKKHSDDQRLAKQLCHRFYVISNAITRHYKPMLDKINLTYPQYVVMMALWEKDDISISELQQKTLIDIGCLSVMLKKMRDKGFIHLVASPVDKRMKKVKLSAEGEALQCRAQQAKDSLQKQEQFPILNEDEQQQLTRLLDKLKLGLV